MKPINHGWSPIESPFHSGERAVQERLGVRTKLEEVGRRVIRDYLPEQHRQFFAQLPFLIAGTVDQQSRPWASILVGSPGFLSTPDQYTLKVSSLPLFGDPLTETLLDGIDIGLLGIELPTRRRNRLNGKVISIASDSFTIQVGQSFGNCPQYIQARSFELTDNTDNFPASKTLSQFESLGDLERQIITSSDTFFIATAFKGNESEKVQGVDVSHRGGKPGFVRIDNNKTLSFPDFAGNLHFNTIGNLLLNPHAGLLFIDFVAGHLLYLTGRAEVIWEGEEVLSFTGAQRIIKFHLLEGRRVERSLSLKFAIPEYSPFLAHTGSWPEVK